MEDIINTRTNFIRSVLWPYAITGARTRLDILCTELELTMPKTEDNLIKLMDEVLSSIILTVKHDGGEAKIGESEVENTLSSLKDKSKLLLQDLFETNKRIKEEKKKLPGPKACCILS